MEALTRKVDRIVAAIEEDVNASGAAAIPAAEPGNGTAAKAEPELQEAAEGQRRVEELEKQNAELRAAAGHARRKTLSSATLALLAKSGADDGQTIEGGALEQALRSLSVEQRIAVKAEMARAGLL